MLEDQGGYISHKLDVFGFITAGNANESIERPSLGAFISLEMKKLVESTPSATAISSIRDREGIAAPRSKWEIVSVETPILSASSA